MIVLHYGPQLWAADLARMAEAGEVATAWCGARRVPMRPPFPPNAAMCRQCVELREAANARIRSGAHDEADREPK